MSMGLEYLRYTYVTDIYRFIATVTKIKMAFPH